MTNPTTNYGWVMPTSASLVTNLPADFNTFGQGVDTSMSQLLGGTTGQVLSKTSATNMAFTWTTPTDQTPLTTKGDLFTFTTTDARLAVGANGETLVADSSAATGLRYTAGTVQANPILNSSFQNWQRGTTGTANSFSPGAGYNADRWQNYYAGSLTVSRQATGDTTNLPFIQYCARVQRNSGQTNTGGVTLGQSFETVNTIPFVGKLATLSYYARAGANYSATSNLLALIVVAGTGTDQNVLFGFTGATDLVNTTNTLTTTWQRFSYTFTVSSNATQLGFLFKENPTGTAGVNDYYEITGVQVDIGSVALPFRTYAGTIQGELAACMRYYWRSEAGSSQQKFAQGPAYSTTALLTNPITLPSPMRVKPTAIDYGGTIWLQQHAGVGGTAITSLTLDGDYINTKQVGMTVGTASGLTAGTIYELKSNSSTSSYIGFSAEL